MNGMIKWGLSHKVITQSMCNNFVVGFYQDINRMSGQCSSPPEPFKIPMCSRVWESWSANWGPPPGGRMESLTLICWDRLDRLGALVNRCKVPSWGNTWVLWLWCGPLAGSSHHLLWSPRRGSASDPRALLYSTSWNPPSADWSSRLS